MTLPLLQDGSCTIKASCLKDADGVAKDCPQLDKCGSCIMWSPREQSGATGRNNGICLLDRDARKTLDCNAAACPYYRPRRDSPAYGEWKKPRPAAARPAGRRRPLGREAPSPSAAALAQKALEGVENARTAELVLELALGPDRPPALLERFRGGTAVLRRADGQAATVPLERWFVWVCRLKKALDAVDAGVAASALSAEDKDKIDKDIKGMRGSLTTFNLLLRDKEDQFVGQKGG